MCKHITVITLMFCTDKKHYMLSNQKQPSSKKRCALVWVKKLRIPGGHLKMAEMALILICLILNWHCITGAIFWLPPLISWSFSKMLWRLHFFLGMTVFEWIHLTLDFVLLDIQCHNITTPSNGEIASCSSGSIGIGYEGDTCNFTCNTGYELTGSDTRTCQSDGSWSGSDNVCRRGAYYQ